jgi:hypothetical protein
MTMHRMTPPLGMLVGVLVTGAPPATAAAITFFGADAGHGEGTRRASHPNADAARASFFANLVGVGTEDFEGFTNGAVGVGTSFGAVTATLTGGSVANVPTGTNGAGRYPVSGNQYWESSSAMTLVFTAPVAAFGFYGIDIGDFDGQVTLTTVSGSPLVVNIGNAVSVTGGGVLYFGFYVDDPTQQFTAITFGNTAAGTDFFGFDDFSIGTLSQVQPPPVGGEVPEPATLLLLGTGLALLAARRRRSRNQQ